MIILTLKFHAKQKSCHLSRAYCLDSIAVAAYRCTSVDAVFSLFMVARVEFFFTYTQEPAHVKHAGGFTLYLTFLPSTHRHSCSTTTTPSDASIWVWVLHIMLQQAAQVSLTIYTVNRVQTSLRTSHTIHLGCRVREEKGARSSRIGEKKIRKICNWLRIPGQPVTSSRAVFYKYLPIRTISTQKTKKRPTADRGLANASPRMYVKKNRQTNIGSQS